MDIEISDVSLPEKYILNEKYEIKEVHYIGEQGIVYFAWDMKAKKEVVIKEFMPYRIANRDMDGKTVVCRSEGCKKKYTQARGVFFQECQCTKIFKDIKEPYDGCILRFLDSFEENSTIYLVVEKVEGKNLAEYLDDESVDNKWNVVRDLIRIVDTMHQKGVIHCDIKPSNIIVRQDGHLTLIDFGTACRLDDNDNKMTFASRGYSAPELYFGKMIDKSTDIYSLGAVIYHILTGYQLPDATDFDDKEKVPRISEFIKISRIKEIVILKTLNRNKKKRLKSLFLLKFII